MVVDVVVSFVGCCCALARTRIAEAAVIAMKKTNSVAAVSARSMIFLRFFGFGC